MCRAPEAPIVTKLNHAHRHGHASPSLYARIRSRLRPLPLPVVLALLPLLPRSFYLNRGYTVWFHLLSAVYGLTRAPFLLKVLVLQGTGICLGWYAALVRDWIADGAFCHTLYRNMPHALLARMVREGPSLPDGAGEYVLLDTRAACAARAASHVLDLLGHPGLLCLLWAAHRRAGGTLQSVLAWPVLVVAWHLSRAWSLVHAHHNAGVPALWYYGHDVYVMSHLHGYRIAYVAEGACFAAAIGCRVCWDRASAGRAGAASSCSRESSVWRRRETTPTLIHSMSGTSAASTRS